MNRLAERVAPWLKIRMVGEPSIAQINETVDRIVYDDGLEDKVRVSILEPLKLLNRVYHPAFETCRGYIVFVFPFVHSFVLYICCPIR